MADEDNLCRAGDEVADEDRQVELELVHASRNDIAARVLARHGISRRVHHLHDIAAVDVAARVRLVRHHDLADYEFILCHGKTS